MWNGQQQLGCLQEPSRSGAVTFKTISEHPHIPTLLPPHLVQAVQCPLGTYTSYGALKINVFCFGISKSDDTVQNYVRKVKTRTIPTILVPTDDNRSLRRYADRNDSV